MHVSPARDWELGLGPRYGAYSAPQAPTWISDLRKSVVERAQQSGEGGREWSGGMGEERGREEYSDEEEREWETLPPFKNSCGHPHASLFTITFVNRSNYRCKVR